MKRAALLLCLILPAHAATINVSAPVTIRDHFENNLGAPTGGAMVAPTSSGLVVLWSELHGNGDKLFLAPLASPYSMIDFNRAVELASTSLQAASLCTGGGLVAVRYLSSVRLFDRDLQPVAPPQVLTGGSSRLAWNGRDFAIAGSPRPAFVDPSGAVRYGATLPAGPEQRGEIVAAVAPAPGGGTLLLAATDASSFCFGCPTVPSRVTLVTLDANDQTQKRTLLGENGYFVFGDNFTLASGDNGSAALWLDLERQARMVTTFDAAGNVKANVPVQTYADVRLVASNGAQLAGDGNEWLILSDGRLTLIDGNGNSLAPPVAIKTGFLPQLVRVGAGSYLLTYVETTDTIFTRIQLVRIETQLKRRHIAGH